MTSVNRNSSIELYRILAMEMIITLHFFSAAQAGGQFAEGSAGYYLYHIAESACICGVNMFVLITGYFAGSKREVEINKILKLCIDVAFWGGV